MSKTNEEFALKTCETYNSLDKPRKLAFMMFMADMLSDCQMREDKEYLAAALKVPEGNLDNMIALQVERIKEAKQNQQDA